jgi:hypothetical protein
MVCRNEGSSCRDLTEQLADCSSPRPPATHRVRMPHVKVGNPTATRSQPQAAGKTTVRGTQHQFFYSVKRHSACNIVFAAHEPTNQPISNRILCALMRPRVAAGCSYTLKRDGETLHSSTWLARTTIDDDGVVGGLPRKTHIDNRLPTTQISLVAPRNRYCLVPLYLNELTASRRNGRQWEWQVEVAPCRKTTQKVWESTCSHNTQEGEH